MNGDLKNFLFTGSYASSAHGKPRASDDIDIVIAPTEDQLRTLMTEFPDDKYYADQEDALDALKHHSQFNVIDFATMWKADLIIRKDREFSRVEFGRRRPHTIAGARVHLTTAEDIVIAKLEWAKIGESARQIEDVAGIIDRQGSRLDLSYIERWVAELELPEQWLQAKEKARGGR